MTLTPELALRHQRAADFFVRRRASGWTGADERELDVWLADATNRALYDGLAVTALDLQQIPRSEEHTSELQSQLTISYAVFCLRSEERRVGKECS